MLKELVAKCPSVLRNNLVYFEACELQNTSKAMYVKTRMHIILLFSISTGLKIRNEALEMLSATLSVKPLR